MKKLIFLAIAVFLAGCAANANHNLNSVLWVQTAAEYQANAYQAYNAAMQNIETAIADQRWTAAIEQTHNFYDLPPAVILDLDETVFDTSKFQAQLVMETSGFQLSAWDEWLKMRRAESIAGAVDFIDQIQAKGIETFFITNRECRKRQESTYSCPQKSDTLENLRNIGITGIDENNVLLKNEYADWGAEKQSRRTFVAQKYRILMIFGDDLGDFIPNVKKEITPEKRSELTAVFHENWGRKWFILPNPMYGSWHQILETPYNQHLQGIYDE